MDTMIKPLLSDKFLAHYKDKQPKWGFNGLGYLVYKRTYSRPILDDKGVTVRTEEWWETIRRCVEGAQAIGSQYTTKEAEQLFDLVFNLKGCFAGRCLWQLGTSTVERFGANSLLNCWFTTITKPADFCFIYENLMLGGGVGFSVKREHIHELPKVKCGVEVSLKDTKDADFIVPDSREGWVELMRRTLDAFFTTGKSFNYSTVLVRGYGEPIRGFGGVASGPRALIAGVEHISTVLRNREGKKLRSIDALDIANIIGSIVVAGNVRRSALLSIGDPDDILYLRAKRWDLGNIPNWRAMSNNSVCIDKYEQIMDEVWNGYQGNGEPYGFINLRNAQKYGRLGEKVLDKCQGFNPCAEIGLESAEACDLSELFLNNIESEEELCTTAKLLYKVQKAICALPFIHKESEEIVHKNFRIGVGVTGICQVSSEKLAWLDACYKELRRFDAEWSKERGWPKSIKLTTVKPSGCSRKDSLIVTSKGILRLDEIGSVDGPTWQPVNDLSVETSKGYQPVRKFYVNGKVPTKLITSSDGFEFESSLNHRYRIVSSSGDYVWKEVKDLQVGDRLVTKLGGYDREFIHHLPLYTRPTKARSRAREITYPTVLTNDLAWFLGLFYGDGSVDRYGVRISINRKEATLFKWLKDFVKTTFNVETKVYDDISIYIHSLEVKNWLKHIGCLKEFCEDIQIPKLIRQSSKSNILGFIDGFWRADGGVHNTSNSWSIASVSKSFIQELGVLCRSIGMNLCIRNAGPGGMGSRDVWILLNRVSTAEKKRYLSKEFKNRHWNGYWLDPIKTITDSEAETYDIEVEKEHSYLLNGAISHNTLSLLGGSTPGVHPAYSAFWIRRVRMSAGDALVAYCKNLGYKVEYVKNFDGTDDHSTVVVEFPCEAGPTAVLAKDVSAVIQLDLLKKLQTIWSDNAVSVTVYYKKEELPAIKEWLKENFETSVKTVSFLLHSEHGFRQAPYEEITEDIYREILKGVKPLTSVVDSGLGEIYGALECAGGACPIK